jgi:hypothetical protein
LTSRLVPASSLLDENALPWVAAEDWR